MSPKRRTEAPTLVERMRHSLAHLLAAAVLERFPTAKLGIGPAIADGFYQDIQFPRALTPEDLRTLEARMRELIAADLPFVETRWTKQKATRFFARQPFKKELIKDLPGRTVGISQVGEFTDLCRGGHVTRTSEIGAFRLSRTAGAYWRGDERHPQLTRVYGLAFATEGELRDHVARLEEAKKRDHRLIAQQQELFVITPEIGGGFPIFAPKGAAVRKALEEFMTQEKERRGYQFVWTPHIAHANIYKQSGHWQKYEVMFPPMEVGDEQYVLKPMNCLHHFQVYLMRPRSYRELPLRIAENGTVYRNEKSGELNGLLRVRALTIDDTHTFVRHAQIPEEIGRVLELTQHIFTTFGFSEYRAQVSVRDPKHKGRYLGSETAWRKAEGALVESVKRQKVPYVVAEGEAAFYGPKIDFLVKDSLGREWQLTTIQLDFNQPENFNLSYINERGTWERPAVLHIAILGSVERFLGILLEHFGGVLPLWLAPIQVAILPVSADARPYAQEVQRELGNVGLRTDLDDRSESIGKKIRDAELRKIPVLLVVGKRESAARTVSLRFHGGKDGGTKALSEACRLLKRAVETRQLTFP